MTKLKVLKLNFANMLLGGTVVGGSFKKVK